MVDSFLPLFKKSRLRKLKTRKGSLGAPVFRGSDLLFGPFPFGIVTKCTTQPKRRLISKKRRDQGYNISFKGTPYLTSTRSTSQSVVGRKSSLWHGNFGVQFMIQTLAFIFLLDYFFKDFMSICVCRVYYEYMCIMSVCVCSVYYVPLVRLVPTVDRRGGQIFWKWSTNGCEPPDSSWELDCVLWKSCHCSYLLSRLSNPLWVN